MKKILIGADSRAIFPRPQEGGDWTGALANLCQGEYEVETIRAEYDHWLFSIYLLEEHIRFLPDDTYEYIIIQSGFHESVCFWPEAVFRSITKSHFNTEALKQPIYRENMLCLHPKFDPKSPKKAYMYDDIDAARKVFWTFKNKAKNVIFVGMHTIKPENGLSREYGLGDKHHYAVLQMNEDFSSIATDSVELPMNPSWILENGYNNCVDGIHYNAKGTAFLAEYIKRLIDRDKKTITSLLASGKNNRDFFEKCIKRGSEIANLTSEGDIVALSRQSIENLLIEFVGCVLYKRNPIVLQYPSEKVSLEDFTKKMNFIKKEINPSLCICDEKFLETYKKFFTSFHELPHCSLESPIQSDPNDIAFLQMSSGTTGNPKILYVTHKELITNCDEYKRTISLDAQSHVVSWLPLYHDMGLVAGFLLPLISDAGFSIIDPFTWLTSPKEMLEMITSNKATHAWMPNFAFNYMAKNIKIEQVKNCDLSSLKRIISCSEPTYKSDLMNFYNNFKEIGLKEKAISVCYALAENVFAVSQSEGIKTTVYNNKEYVSCGKILPGVSVLIVKDGKDVTEDSHGMVYIKSTSHPKINKEEELFYGYYNTGDIGFVEDQEVYIIDRQKDSFVTYGINVYPSQVERVISSLKHIKSGRVACFGVMNKAKGTSEVYICAETTEPAATHPEIKKAVMKKAKDTFNFSAKVYIKNVGFLTKTPSGKISRHNTMDKLCNQ